MTPVLHHENSPRTPGALSGTKLNDYGRGRVLTYAVARWYCP